jgi:hypothetical protein
MATFPSLLRAYMVRGRWSNGKLAKATGCDRAAESNCQFVGYNHPNGIEVPGRVTTTPGTRHRRVIPMAPIQPTLYCRACRARHPRDQFSGRTGKNGRYHTWADCDMARSQRTTPARAVDLPGEQWRAVVGFEGIYEISNYTRVRRAVASPQSPAGRLLSHTVTSYGYSVVNLSKRDGGRAYFVHRLLVEAFCGPIPEGLVVNHIDGCKTNNTLDNLEVVTSAENNRHAHRTGLSNSRGEHNPAAKLTSGDVLLIRASSESRTALADRFGVRPDTIDVVRRGGTWGHV